MPVAQRNCGFNARGHHSREEEQPQHKQVPFTKLFHSIVVKGILAQEEANIYGEGQQMIGEHLGPDLVLSFENIKTAVLLTGSSCSTKKT